MIKTSVEVVGRDLSKKPAKVALPLDTLLPALSSPEARVREEARKGLAHHGINAVQNLVQLASSPEPQTRWEAAKALGEIKHIKPAEALASMLDDEDHDVRWVAAEGLMAIGHDGVQPILVELIEHGDSIRVRESALFAIKRLAAQQDSDLLSPVISALHGSVSVFEVPVAAFRALQRFRKRHQQS